MPKRSAQEKINFYNNKIRKLEEQQHRRRLSSSSSSSDSSSKEEYIEGHDNNNWLEQDASIAGVQAQTEAEVYEEVPVSLTVDLPPESAEPHAGPSAVEAAELEVAEPPLDPDILAALGESTSDSPEFGPKIHETLSSLWLPLLKKGLQKDAKDNIQKDYPIPDNCRLLQAPKLNVEIVAAVAEMIKNRDRKLLNQQQQLGVGITALNKGMECLLKNENRTNALKHLGDACRLLTDFHFMLTDYRKKLLTPCLDKHFMQVIQDSDRDDTLFGNTLSEKIKASKVIEKQGLQIKKPPPPARTTGNPRFPAPRSAFQGNWQATPPARYPSNRGGRGTYRRPALTSTHRPQQHAPPAPAAAHRGPSQPRPRAPTHQ